MKNYSLTSTDETLFNGRTVIEEVWEPGLHLGEGGGEYKVPKGGIPKRLFTLTKEMPI